MDYGELHQPITVQKYNPDSLLPSTIPEFALEINRSTELHTVLQLNMLLCIAHVMPKIQLHDNVSTCLGYSVINNE